MMKWLMVILLVISTTVWSTTYYIDYEGGDNTNNGTSKSTPWKHAPGMHGTSDNVLAYEAAHPEPSGTTGAGSISTI